MIRIPQLPSSFYDDDPVLAHIRQAAWSPDTNPVSPDAVLGVLLCRVAAMTPPRIVLPDVGGSLNFITGIVGPPGIGKTTANRIARRLLDDINTPLDNKPIGSGEGLVEAYLRRQKVQDGETGRWEKVQAHTSAYFYVDEAETFINSRKRDNGSNTLATLRSMWSGATGGSTNATEETTRLLEDGSYRFACAMGFQPVYAAQLLRDDAAGTPQRFLWVSALDVNIPDVPSSWPGRLNVRQPTGDTIPVDREIRRIIRGESVRKTRGELVVDSHDTHGRFLQLKTAALLSILCDGSDGVSPRWWAKASELVETSRNIRRAIQDDEAAKVRQAEDDALEHQIAREDTKAEHRAMRISRNLGKRARQRGSAPFGSLVKDLASRDRHDADLGHALEHGFLVQIGKADNYGPGPNVPSA